jgi:ABC-type Zn uptake system ZnuABC Zn-binding protein ZnuA
VQLLIIYSTLFEYIKAFVDIFKQNHKEYVKKLEEVESMKKTYLNQFQRLKKKLRYLDESCAK